MLLDEILSLSNAWEAKLHVTISMIVNGAGQPLDGEVGVAPGEIMPDNRFP